MSCKEKMNNWRGYIMGILKDTVGKTKKLAANMIDTAKEAAQKKIEEDRNRREEKERQFKESFPYKHMLTIREKNIFSSKESGLWEEITNESYVITDADEKPVYIAKEGFWLGSYNYRITNLEKKVIGHVRRHLINFGYPFVKERHGCTVKVAETNEKFRLTTYLSFKEREFGGTERAYKVTCKDKKKLAKEFKITKGNKKIAHIYKVSSDDGFLASRYIVGYDNENDENIAVLNSLAIHLIMHAS